MSDKRAAKCTEKGFFKPAMRALSRQICALGYSETDYADINKITKSYSNVKLAVCSCANFPYGAFNVYKEIAGSDAQAVVLLGDYIYEYKAGEYPAAEDVAAGRQEEIGGEIITLEQYRARYSLYRRDQDLQAAHAAKPFICVWDDHELANDAYKGGAQNHNDGEGSFAERRAAAFQAYYEWLPIRTGADNAKIWRGFEFGNLVNLTMLDTRQFARDKSLSYDDYISETGIDQAAFAADLGNLSRTLLGDEQQQFADASVRDSNATWQVLGQQILMGHIKVPAELLLSLSKIEKLISAGQDASAAQQQTAQLLGELAQIKGCILQGDPGVTDAERARIETVAPYNLDA
ncbi:alkaline phosphatase D family protein [Bacterioplanoides pacificum]|uniref:Alkaline phosphatase D family protein n=1 Tax=Bacterioplanoides pacificum TaxID=1171596 RepID=A0ABV7VNG9_9GAMM